MKHTLPLAAAVLTIGGALIARPSVAQYRSTPPAKPSTAPVISNPVPKGNPPTFLAQRRIIPPVKPGAILQLAQRRMHPPVKGGRAI